MKPRRPALPPSPRHCPNRPPAFPRDASACVCLIMRNSDSGMRLPVDHPVGIEDLVPAMLGVGLREHHQLDVGRVAADAAEIVDQVVDLVVGQRQAQAPVGGLQRRAAVGRADRRAPAAAAWLRGTEPSASASESSTVSVMRSWISGSRASRAAMLSRRPPAFEADSRPAFDALHGVQSAVSARCRLPWRTRGDGAQAGHHQQDMRRGGLRVPTSGRRSATSPARAGSPSPSGRASLTKCQY